MKNRLRLTGPRADLSEPATQLEIYRQLKSQEGRARREIKIGEQINGYVIMKPRGPITPVIDLIKARTAPPRGGELAVIDDLKSDMMKAYDRRADALGLELAALLEVEELAKGGQTFKPPKAAIDAAKRGLELRAKYKRGGLSTREAGEQGIGSGVQRAVNLARGDALDLDTLKMMRGFFARHERNKDNRNEKGEPAAGMIAWLLWGGDPARAWVNRTLDTLEDTDK